MGCRTLFITHYHEIADLERTRSGVINLNVAVREWNNQVIFLRKILPVVPTNTGFRLRGSRPSRQCSQQAEDPQQPKAELNAGVPV
jgi:hypothetical protein